VPLRDTPQKDAPKPKSGRRLLHSANLGAQGSARPRLKQPPRLFVPSGTGVNSRGEDQARVVPLRDTPQTNAPKPQSGQRPSSLREPRRAGLRPFKPPTLSQSVCRCVVRVRVQLPNRQPNPLHHPPQKPGIASPQQRLVTDLPHPPAIDATRTPAKISPTGGVPP
jgi:hypothetical protein